jgi:hypothetical protein
MSIRKLTDKQARELVVDTEPWLSCDDCFRLMDEYVELLAADPDSRAMPQLRVHLRACPACAEEAESLLALVREDQ